MKINKGEKIAIRLIGLLSFCLLSMAVAKGEDTNNGLAVSDEGKCLTISSDEGFENLGNIDNVIKIVIGSEVTKIPYAIFYEQDQITEIQFDTNSKLTIIDDFAFQQTSITQINIPASVETIGMLAFGVCTDLESITFNKKSNLRNINDLAFAETKITSIEFPASLETIGNDVFKDCPVLKSISFEEGSKITTIDQSFINKNIVSITIPASVKTIKGQAFYQCKHLTEVKFCENSQLETIEDFAFQEVPITKIELPSSIRTIKEQAFCLCSNLTNVEFSENSQLETIGKMAFDGTAIKSIEIPASVKTIGENVFGDCNNLTEVKFSENSQLETIGISAFQGKNIKSIEIPASVKTIDIQAFYQCKHLTDVKFSENSQLETIEDFAFQEIPITKIELPSSIRTIKEQAFCLCSNLTNVEFSENSQLETIGKMAFDGTAINSIEIPASVKTIGENVFGDCNNLTEVKFSENSQLETIGISAFEGKNIKSIEIPASVKTIDIQAFYQCKHLTEVKFSENSRLETIEQLAFQETPIKAIEFPPSIETISKQAFYNCSALSEVTFKKNKDQTTALKTIGELAFYGLPIKIIELPPSIETIEDGVFGKCTNLERVILTGKKVIPKIGDNLFDGIDSPSHLCFPLEKIDEYESVLSGYSLIPGYYQTTIKQPEKGTLIIRVKNRQLDNEDRVFEDESLSDINTLDADKKIKVSVGISYNDGFDNCEIYANEEKIGIGEYEVTQDVTFSAKNFIVQKVKINFSQPEHGKITVFDKENKKIHNGDKVDYGTELTINLTLSPGYQGGTIKVNGSEITNNTYTIKGDITITVENINESTEPPYVPDLPYDPVYYTVSLPTVEGVSTDPVAGDYEVGSWSSFRFFLTLDEGYTEKSLPVVVTDRGEIIEPRQSDGAYIIKYVRQDIMISISGIVPDIITGIADINSETLLRVVDGTLLISVPQTADAFITDTSGRILRTLRLVPGTTRVEGLHSGIYIVKIAGQEGRKVIVN